MLLFLLAGCPTPTERGPEVRHGVAPLVEHCDAVEIDTSWTLRHAGPASARVADLVTAGSLQMGCEDELPELAREDGLRSDGLQLAVLDELTDVERVRLEGTFDVDLDLPEQGFAIGWTRGSVLIVGGSHRGLVFGVTSWLQSLDGVEQQQGVWAPDWRAPFPQTCSAYEADCGDDAACWDEGWSRPTRVAWCTETVHDAPDIDVRMAFPAFKGTLNAHFLPNLVHAELGRCTSPLDTEPFWDATLGCAPGVGTCDQVRVRLDTLVAGRFSHALDEGYPTAVADSARALTGCSGKALYADIDDYLLARGIELVPTVFGLEARVADTPIAGPVIPQDEPAELWGVEGDASLAEGLGIQRRSVQACDQDGATFLAPDCGSLDDQGRVVVPLAETEIWDVGATPVPPALSDCDDFALCQVKGCWDEDYTGGDAMLTPVADCTNPALRLYLPDDERAGRWYVLRFTAIVTDTADLRVKFITKDTHGITNAQDVTPIQTYADEDYLETKPSLRSLADEVVFSYVFRVPDDARIQDSYLQLLGVAGSETFVDDLQVFELDGQLAGVDPASVRVWSGGVELDSSCWSVEPGWTAPLSIRSYFDQAGELAWPLASIEVDPACVDGELELAYTSLVHSGLWPGLSTRQSHASFVPGVARRAWWEHEQGPAAQLDAMGGAGEFVSLSDLGGELRGMGRADWSPAEVLSTYVCGVREAACEREGDCTDAPRCLDGLSAGEPCSCAETTSPTRLLLSSDMLTPWHNGGDGGVAVREAYQVPHNGPALGSWTAREALPQGTTVFSWWHYDARRVGQDAISTETMMGFVRDLTGSGLAVIGASAWDVDNTRVWAALAAGAGRTHDLDIPGVAQFGWGTDGVAPQVMTQAGRLFWHPEWVFVDDWHLSDAVDLPAGSDLERWDVVGDATLQDSTPSWPQVGRSLAVEGDVAWSGSPVPIADRAGGSTVLVRAHIDAPEGCQVTGGVDADGVWLDGVVVPGMTGQTDIWSLWVDVSAGTAGVAPSFWLEGCAGGVLDHIALFQSLPSSDFPAPLVERGLEDWDSPDSSDPRAKICGDGLVWDCKAGHTFVPPG